MNMEESISPLDRNTAPQFKGKVALGLGITQVTIGVLVFLFEVVSRAIGGALSIALTGIWIGIIFIINGVIGIQAGSKKSRCLVTTFMVMSILCAVIGAGLFGYAMVSMVIQDIVSYSNVEYTAEVAHRKNVVFGMAGSMMVCGIAELVIAIISSAFCCHGMCSCCHRKTATQVVYVPEGKA